MGIFVSLLTLPLAPVRGVVWVAEQVATEAERQWSDPAAVEAGLRDVQLRRERGEIDEAEAVRLEDELVRRLMP